MSVDPLGCRFRHDDPARHGIERVAGASAAQALTHGLSQNVRVSERVLPRLFRAARAAADRLRVDGRMTVFVYASPEINASVCTDAESAGILTFISSALLTSLEEAEWLFVIGHELGHHVYGHDRYPPVVPPAPSLRLLELRRAAEISADRAGLIACGDVETALRAMLKVASGLDERLLEVDVSDYIRQISELRETAGDDRLWYSTHPPFPVRVRAVLRFDSVIRQMAARGDVAEVLRGVDDDVQRDLRAVTASGGGGRFVDQGTAAAFWSAATVVCRDGKFTADEQALMARHFGRDRVESLKGVLESSGSREDALRHVGEKAAAAWRNLADAPLVALEAFHECRARLAAAGMAFDDGRDAG